MENVKTLQEQIHYKYTQNSEMILKMKEIETSIFCRISEDINSKKDNKQ